MTATPAELLAAAERSADAAGRRDKAGWTGLFTADATVEDPVGSRPHRGADEIERFYDTFIGPREIVFNRDVDIVAGHTVVRDVTLDVTMDAASGLVMSVPMFIRYDLVDTEGELKIAQLRAFWELSAMLGQFARKGAAAVPASLRMSRGLLGNQGLGGTVGFATGLRRAGRAQRESIAQFTAAVSRGDELGARRALTGAAIISLGDDTDINLSQFVALLRGVKWTKSVTSGRSVAAAFTRKEIRGVAIIDIGTGPHGLNRIRLYWPEILGGGPPPLDDRAESDQ